MSSSFWKLWSRDVTLGLGTEYREEGLSIRTQDSKSLPETTTNLARTTALIDSGNKLAFEKGALFRSEWVNEAQRRSQARQVPSPSQM